jgi:hypothetical protein
VRGDLLLASGDHAAAEENYHLAFTVARRQSAKLEELRAAMSMARLWRDQGKRNEARDLLAPQTCLVRVPCQRTPKSPCEPSNRSCSRAVTR